MERGGRMFFATGDTHGEWTRFSSKNFPEGKTLSRDDYVFIMGDFGIWDDSAREKHDFDWLAQKPFTICFVSGNHENYDMLEQLPIEEWNGGKVNFIRDNIIHLRRGQVFTINGVKIFTFGGARSHDIQQGILDPDDPQFDKKKKILNKLGGMYRINHISWWEQEMPGAKELAEGIRNLDKHSWQVDYIFTHCAATDIQKQLTGESTAYQSDCLTDYLEMIRRKAEYKWWVFGHYHMNCSMNDRDVVLYEQIVTIPDKWGKDIE